MKKYFFTVLIFLYILVFPVLSQDGLEQQYSAIELLRIAHRVFPEAVLTYSSVSFYVDYDNRYFNSTV